MRRCLDLLLKDDDLHHEPTSREEIASLLRLAERDLAKAQISDLYPDGRLAFAYNAALQLATAFLRVQRIRIGAHSHHVRTFRELKRLIPVEQRQFALDFDRARRKRNTLMYDQAGAISEHEAQEFIAEVKDFREWLSHELSTRFKEYLPDKGSRSEHDDKLS